MKTVFLINASDAQALVLIPLLEANGIFVERRFSAAAAPSYVYSGASVIGSSLYVPEDQLEFALALIEAKPEGEFDAPEDEA